MDSNKLNSVLSQNNNNTEMKNILNNISKKPYYSSKAQPVRQQKSNFQMYNNKGIGSHQADLEHLKRNEYYDKNEFERQSSNSYNQFQTTQPRTKSHYSQINSTTNNQRSENRYDMNNYYGDGNSSINNNNLDNVVSIQDYQEFLNRNNITNQRNNYIPNNKYSKNNNNNNNNADDRIYETDNNANYPYYNDQINSYANTENNLQSSSQSNFSQFYKNSNNKYQDKRYTTDISSPKDLNNELGNRYYVDSIYQAKDKLTSKHQKSCSPQKNYSVVVKQNVSNDSNDYYPNFYNNDRSRSISNNITVNSKARAKSLNKPPFRILNKKPKNSVNISSYNNNNNADLSHTNINTNTNNISAYIQAKRNPINKSKSKTIISNVLDKDFSINSPSRKKLQERELKQSQINDMKKSLEENPLFDNRYLSEQYDPEGEHLGIQYSTYVKNKELFGKSNKTTMTNAFNNSSKSSTIGQRKVKSKSNNIYNNSNNKIYYEDEDKSITVKMEYLLGSPFEKYADALEAVVKAIDEESVVRDVEGEENRDKDNELFNKNHSGSKDITPNFLNNGNKKQNKLNNEAIYKHVSDINVINNNNSSNSNNQMSIQESALPVELNEKNEFDIKINNTYNSNNNEINNLNETNTTIMFTFIKADLTEKILSLINKTTDNRRQVRLGAVVGLYIILKKYEIEDLENNENSNNGLSLKKEILSTTINLIQNYEIQEELFLVATLELMSLFTLNESTNEVVIGNLQLICMFLTDFNFPKLQKASFNLIMKTGETGIKTLIELSSKDYIEYQNFILTSLARTPHIQKTVITKALLNEVFNSNNNTRYSALAGLNRLWEIVDEETVLKIANFFTDNNNVKIEKVFLASVMRSSGLLGEKVLLDQLASNKDFAVKVAAISSLANRIPKYPRYLDIRIDGNNSYSISNNLPGKFCVYYGNVTPIMYDKLIACETGFSEKFNLNKTINNSSDVNNGISKYGEIIYDKNALHNTNSGPFIKEKSYYSNFSNLNNTDCGVNVKLGHISRSKSKAKSKSNLKTISSSLLVNNGAVNNNSLFVSNVNSNNKNDNLSLSQASGFFDNEYTTLDNKILNGSYFREDLNNNMNTKDIEVNSLLYTKDYLELNTRDFLASLNRMITLNIDHSNPRLIHVGHENYIDDLGSILNERINDLCVNDNLNNSYIENSTNEFYNSNKDALKSDTKKLINTLQFFLINESKVQNNLYYNKNNNNENTGKIESNENGYYFISKEVIKSICLCLKDHSNAVRDAACAALGQIGLPEAFLSVNPLLNLLNVESDVNVKSRAIWALGRLAPACEEDVLHVLNNNLKSQLWKIKSITLFSISNFKEKAVGICLPTLLKLLKESPINKPMIAETIVKLGEEGEKLSLKLLSLESDSNYKLKASICYALGKVPLNSKNIDFVLESLFKAASNHTNLEAGLIRKNALFSIKTLFNLNNDNESITYLRKKNVIPFFYQKLGDREADIQDFTIDFIRTLGPQGELLFIEGLSKDTNPSIRSSSAKGLARIGVSTLRTLLCGLYDENPNVRKVVETQILKFCFDDILFEFYNKQPQLLSLKLTIKDILEKRISLTVQMKKYLIEFLNLIDFHEMEKKKVKEIESKISVNYHTDKDQELIIQKPSDDLRDASFSNHSGNYKQFLRKENSIRNFN